MHPIFFGANALSSRKIYITWSGGDCIQQYVLNINGTEITRNDTYYIFNAPGNGIYIIQLTSFDYFGMALNTSTIYYSLLREFLQYKFKIIIIYSKAYGFEVQPDVQCFANGTAKVTIIIVVLDFINYRLVIFGHLYRTIMWNNNLLYCLVGYFCLILLLLLLQKEIVRSKGYLNLNYPMLQKPTCTGLILLTLLDRHQWNLVV